MKAGPSNRARREIRRGDHRISSRADVRIVAEVREPGLGRIQAEINDLSLTGFRMRCLTRLNSDKLQFMKLPSFAALEFHIAWQDGELYGCEFEKPLYPAVFNHIVTLYPTLKMVEN